MVRAKSACVPNAATVAALEELERGGGEVAHGPTSQLFDAMTFEEIDACAKELFSKANDVAIWSYIIKNAVEELKARRQDEQENGGYTTKRKNNGSGGACHNCLGIDSRASANRANAATRCS